MWSTKTRSRKKLLSGLALAAAFAGVPAARAASLVNFDNLAPDTPVNTQYATSGVVFNGVSGDGAHTSKGQVTAHSGTNVLIVTPTSNEFSGGPLKGTFITPQKTVSLFGGYVLFNFGATTLQGTLNGFDQNGTLVASDGPKAVTGGATTTPFSLTSAQANIASFSLDLGLFTFVVIDDLQFDGGAVITPPPSPPVVNLFTPLSGSEDLFDNPMVVTGTVSGQGLLSTVQTILIYSNPPPGSPAPPEFDGSISLINGSFDSSKTGVGAGFTTLSVGSYILTVTATNVAGQTGSATVQFSNFPTVLGPKQPADVHFTQGSAGCQVVFFTDSTATALFPVPGGNATAIAMPPKIAGKWLNVKDYSILRGDGTLGCPTGAAVTTTVSVFTSDIQLQDFTRGRIYDLDPSTGVQPTYSPKVFADAIGVLSTYSDPDFPTPFDDPFGLNEVGAPLHDPVQSMFGDDPTWLFQRFARSSVSGPDSTLEIHGSDHTLYVERVGGSKLDFDTALADAHAQGKFDVSIVPAVWEHFPCLFNAAAGQFICSVAHPHIQAISPVHGVPIYTSASAVDNPDAFCDNSTVCDTPIFLPFGLDTAWSGVPLKSTLSDEPTVADHTNVFTEGWVRESQPSSTDQKLTHEHMHESGTASTLDVIGCVVGIILFGDPGCDAVGELGNSLGGGGWADWDLHIRPLAISAIDPNAGLLHLPAGLGLTKLPPPFWNLLASNGDPNVELDTDCGASIPTVGDMEIEFEADWQNGWVGLPGNHPVSVGSLVALDGRWIIDCGHPPYHSEIHPPHTIMFFEMSPPPAGLSVTNVAAQDQVVTRAQVWVNEFYEGALFSVDVWPPPRPTPDSELNALFVSFNGPGGGVLKNADGSFRGFSFTNDAVGDPATVSAQAATAVVTFGNSGLFVQVSGPGANHQVLNTGQDVFPLDHPDTAGGAVGSLMGRWYVGWNQ